VGKSLVGTAAMGVPLYFAATSWWPIGRGFQIGYFLLINLIAAWIYYFVTRALKMPETAYLDRVFARGKAA
jgi:hypothetical protein